MSASYRIFDITLKSKTLISSSLVRCVFEGADIHRMKLEAPDQRIKLLFPAADGKIPQLVNSPDWYGDYMAIPKEQRPVMRTYTLRALRREQNQMDVEFVLHGVNGPASAWATHAEPGDTIQTVAPNGDFDGDSGGYEWAPPAQLQQALLIADETAVPADTCLSRRGSRVRAPSVPPLFRSPELAITQGFVVSALGKTVRPNERGRQTGPLFLRTTPSSSNRRCVRGPYSCTAQASRRSGCTGSARVGPKRWCIPCPAGFPR